MENQKQIENEKKLDLLRNLLKNRGAIDTILVLSLKPMLYADFFKALEKISYYNAFNRVSEDLIRARLVKHKFSELGHKKIVLTDLGNKLKELIHEILDSIIFSEEDERKGTTDESISNNT